MMEYIKLFWEDAPEGEPSVILYEVDTENERLALHSIDIFADGRTRNIPDLYDGAIEITPIPGGIERPCLGRGIPRLHHRKSGI